MDGTSLLGELKRRGVFKAAVWYCGSGYALLEIISMVDDPLGLPVWLLRATIVALVVLFPAVLAASWFFDLTFAGLVRTGELTPFELELHPGLTDRWLWLGLGAGLLLGFGVVQGWRSYTDPGLIPTESLETFNKAARDLTAAQQIRDPAMKRDSARNAVALLEQVLDEAPKWPRAWGALADARALLAESPGEGFLEHRDAAREALDEAYALDPDDAEVLVRRARFLLEFEDDPTGASAILRPLVEHDPRNAAAAALLAIALAELGQWTEREALGRRWRELAPESAEAARAHAGALVALARYGEAATAYAQAATLARGASLDIALEQALIPLHERGDLRAFAEALAQNQDRFANRWRWTRTRVAAALALGDSEDARRLLDSTRADDWPVGERDHLLALVAQAEGDGSASRAAAARALAALEAASAIELRPRTLAERMSARARLHGLLGDPTRGLALLTSAESLVRADDASAHGIALRHALALAYRVCGEPGRADAHRNWLAVHPTPMSSARTLDLDPGIPP